VGEPLPEPFETPDTSRRRTGLLVGLATAALVAATVVAAVLLTGGDRQPDDAGGQDPSQSPGTQPTPTQATPTSPPVATTIPEDNLLVAVTNDSGNSRIISVNVRTGERERLTDGPADVLPALSPDRSTVIYLKQIADQQTIPYVLDVASGRERPLLNATSPCTYSIRPAWNPSGDQLALLCVDGGVATGMYIVDLDGQLVADLATPGTPEGAPTWTSDDQLVYTQAGADANSPTTLWSINADGSSPTELTDGSTGSDSHPDWSEEAGLLLFSRTEEGSNYGNLGVLDAQLNPVDGGVSQGLSVAHPVWSPDGTEVAFTMLDDTRAPRLWVGPVDASGEPTMVPGIEGAPGPPVWASR
jgi:Tol biopolymer transport system component